MDRVRSSQLLSAAAGTIAVLLLGFPAHALAQAHEHPADEAASARGTSTFQIPEGVELEHLDLHAALLAAAEQGGRVGEAARDVASLLGPHFKREAEIALPPLALLEKLALGEATPDMAAVLALTDTLSLELPQMLQEHAAIRDAVERLATVAEEEELTRYADLAHGILLHARIEEQVTYPAALLVGRYVRLALSAPSAAMGVTGMTCMMMGSGENPSGEAGMHERTDGKLDAAGEEKPMGMESEAAGGTEMMMEMMRGMMMRCEMENGEDGPPAPQH